MSNIQELNTKIAFGTWTNDELNTMVEAVKYARTKLVKSNMSALQIGDNVNWDSAKSGKNSTGVVIKIAKKYVTVKTITGLWRVPANMLTPVVEDEWTPDNADFCDPGSRHHY
jgi:sRNA-binding protein